MPSREGVIANRPLISADDAGHHRETGRQPGRIKTTRSIENRHDGIAEFASRESGLRTQQPAPGTSRGHRLALRRRTNRLTT